MASTEALEKALRVLTTVFASSLVTNHELLAQLGISAHRGPQSSCKDPACVSGRAIVEASEELLEK